MHLSNVVAAVAASLLLAPSISPAEYTIDNLIEETGVREGPAALRESRRWDVTRMIIVRDIGLDLSEFDDSNVVLVDSLNEALPLAADAGAIVGFCDDDLLSVAPHVSWVQIYSAGAERCFPSEVLSGGDVTLTNMQKMSSPVVAEHAIAMMLSLTRNLPVFTDDMDQGEWKRSATFTDGMTTVSGKTMLVLGLGGIGTEIARRGAGLGMRVVATRNSSREGPDFVDYVGLSDEMTSLARDADVIVNALPLTDTTRGLLDAEFFEAGGNAGPRYFINVGRGATVDTQALLAAIQSGQLAGAGLDVTDPEPLPRDHPLWREQNVIITPHVSSRGSDRFRYQLLTLENMRRYLAGDRLLNVVDPEKGY
jgi:phosphoglycerate dehydrogenase-like enzyme